MATGLPDSKATTDRDRLPEWITPAEIEDTVRVWQRFYDRPLTQEEAVEIIMNVTHLFDVLFEADRDEELCRPGESQQP